MSNLSVSLDPIRRIFTMKGDGVLDWQILNGQAIAKKIVFELNSNIKVLNGSLLFSEFTELEEIEGILDTSECKNFSSFYLNCHKLKKPLAYLDTSKANKMDSMFLGCHSLEEIRFNDVSKCKTFKGIFDECYSLKKVNGRPKEEFM